MFFALLTKTSFNLYANMHMSEDPKMKFDFAGLTFVDLGMALLNQARNEKYYYIKVVHEYQKKRDIYLMAI